MEFTGYSVSATGDCIQRANFRQRGEFVLAQFGNAAGEIVNGSEWSTSAFTDQRLSSLFAQAANVAQAKAQRDFDASSGSRVPNCERSRDSSAPRICSGVGMTKCLLGTGN